MRYFVPGRIEVVGKHTDYAGGRSLVCAVERGFTVTAELRTDDVIRVRSAGSEAVFRLEPDLRPDMTSWAGYPQTVARRVARNFPSARRGVDVTLDSNLPRASGMSSSSAVVVSMFMVLADVNRLAETPEYQSNVASGEDLAGYLGTVENGQTFKALAGDRGVGTFGGSEDHTAILLSRAGRLVQYAYCPVREEAEVAWPDGWVFAIASSGVVAEKAKGAMDRFNRASLLARAALEEWNRASGRTGATLADAVRQGGSEAIVRVLSRSTRADFTAADLVDRFEQFHVENEQVVPGVRQAIERADWRTLGEIVDRSQHLTETKLKNQVPETAFLARSARDLGAAAASAFGAGFGGSVWAMVRDIDAPTFLQKWQGAYQAAFPECASRAEFFTTRPAPPARRLSDAL